MIEKLSKIIKPLVVALVGVYLANKFNIFCYISFIPQDKAFDICITVYFAVLEIFSELLMEIIHAKFLSELSVIFSLNDTEISIESTPIIKFNSSDLAEATITVQIIGRKKHFINSQLILPDISFATMQANIRDKETSVDNAGNYIIALEKMFGATEKRTVLSSSFRITFAKDPIDSERTIEISPELKSNILFNSHLFITYRHNKVLLKVER